MNGSTAAAVSHILTLRHLQAHASDHVVHGGAPGEVPPGQIGRVDPDGKPLGSHGGLSDEQQMELDKEHQEATLRVSGSYPVSGYEADHDSSLATCIMAQYHTFYDVDVNLVCV